MRYFYIDIWCSFSSSANLTIITRVNSISIRASSSICLYLFSTVSYWYWISNYLVISRFLRSSYSFCLSLASCSSWSRNNRISSISYLSLIFLSYSSLSAYYRVSLSAYSWALSCLICASFLSLSYWYWIFLMKSLLSRSFTFYNYSCLSYKLISMF